MGAPPIAVPQRNHRRQQPAIPKELRKEITKHTRAVAKKYHRLFDNDHRLKDQITRLVKALLPPQPRRGGPRDQTITHAIRLHSKFRRLYNSEKPRELWYRVAGKLIPDFGSYNDLGQRALVDDLRNRVKSRLRKRPARKPRRISLL